MVVWSLCSVLTSARWHCYYFVPSQGWQRALPFLSAAARRAGDDMRSECGCPFTSGFSRRRNCGCPAITRQGADVLFPAGLESRSPASVLTLRSLGCAPLPLPSSPFNLRTTDPISETLRALTSKPRQPESSCPPPPPARRTLRLRTKVTTSGPWGQLLRGQGPKPEPQNHPRSPNSPQNSSLQFTGDFHLPWTGEVCFLSLILKWKRRVGFF